MREDDGEGLMRVEGRRVCRVTEESGWDKSM